MAGSAGTVRRDERLARGLVNDTRMAWSAFKLLEGGSGEADDPTRTRPCNPPWRVASPLDGPATITLLTELSLHASLCLKGKGYQ